MMPFALTVVSVSPKMVIGVVAVRAGTRHWYVQPRDLSRGQWYMMHGQVSITNKIVKLPESRSIVVKWEGIE